ncbi:hypothetical protein HNP82_001384 [Catenibacillus scindens]|uniref:Uncharacterized protein n=1 Tax=Catenibacillus scindens TaxID=673271 RepID=A0A7W8HA66_9FIRM|nr:hypothetical protein [Catenibacillus scindens]
MFLMPSQIPRSYKRKREIPLSRSEKNRQGYFIFKSMSCGFIEGTDVEIKMNMGNIGVETYAEDHLTIACDSVY